MTLIGVTTCLFIIGIAVVTLPIAVLLVECVAALWPTRLATDRAARSRVAVLVPAHNEEEVLAATLKTLMPQLALGDRLLVIADNCTDRTAAVARECGAEVVERHDAMRRGKGYAMDAGLKALSENPPDIVIFVDADCDVHDGAISELARCVTATGRPAQSSYVMEASTTGGFGQRISAFAFAVKNVARCAGLTRLGLPCLMMGSGMALTWDMAGKVDLRHGRVGEETQFGLDLARVGHPPIFCERALVTSRLPQTDQVARAQRGRWEHTHLMMLVNHVPRLIAQTITRGRLSLLALALELSVPPVTLIVLLWSTVTLAALIAALCGMTWPLVAMVIAGAMFTSAIGAAWWCVGRSILPLRALLAAPAYVLWKLPFYLLLPIRRYTAWTRTERDASPRLTD